MYKTDNIFALSTLLGKSAISIIRVSGHDLSHLVHAYQLELKPNYVTRKLLKSAYDASYIDDCLVIYFKAPQSFTGEDVIEFHLHGSIAVVKKLLKELSNLEGYRMADPGEFSKRAFYNNKMDLAQAEGLASLIEAETEVQRQVALRQMSGQQSAIYNLWRQNLIEILAKFEAFIDFPEEDIPIDQLKEGQQNIEHLINQMERYIKAAETTEVIEHGLRVAIVGPTNAGKSTLINKLAQREVAIVSDIAGTTRDVIEVKMDIKGYPVIIYDTAGIREAVDIIEQKGIQKSRTTLQGCDICLVVVDALDIDLSVLVEVTSLNKPYKLIINKLDLIDGPSKAYENSIKVSLTKDKGVDEVINFLTDYIVQNYSLEGELCTSRHKALVVKAIEMLKVVDLTDTLEITAEYVKQAANFLGQITGKIDIEEILDTIFAKFCIGK